MNIIEEIKKLKSEANAVILAHYYVDDSVQAIADYVGDSFYLSQVATKIDCQTIIFCGVSFMGESAKILNPQKTVLLPDVSADCPMAHMADIQTINELRAKYDDLAVVCYINSTAELKSYSDICVTSSNAVNIVSKLENENIFFIPDENLGRYVASKIPNKNIILNDGFCHVHKSINAKLLSEAKKAHPQALVLSHPECSQNVLELSDYIGSTKGIINFANASQNKEFIICTEMGVFYELNNSNKNKRFYSVGHRQFCPNMKKITLEKIALCLRNKNTEVHLDEALSQKAYVPLKRMLELGN